MSKEITADLSWLHAQKEDCTNCESRNTEKGLEERATEQEQKILVEMVQLPLPPSDVLRHPSVYKGPYFPCIDLGILTPPPKLA